MGDLPGDRLLLLLRTSGLVFLQALPLALFLFFFFPRYQGVLQIGMDDSSTGLTDTLKPGSISRLANDDSTAMTVRITDGRFLSPETLYWRALVLWNYENGAWTTGGARKLNNDEIPKNAPETAVIDQEITIWPHFHNWLFALDYPIHEAEHFSGEPGWSEYRFGGIVQMAGMGGLNQMERYRIQSASILADATLTPEERERGLQLPDGKGDQIEPRVKALADRLHQGCADESAYINAVLHFFRHGGFVYSEDPGPSGPHALSNFLFKRKVGFCEHYASAFALLMRLEGVPARLVAGYQGAQFNPYKDIYIVKQSNAHAWDEVWVAAEKRWRRVDPTAIIAGGDNLSGTNQVRRGRNDGLSIDVANHRLTILPAAYMPDWMRQSLQEMQLRRQEIEADWDDWIFSYNPQMQSRWAQALGLGRGGRFALGFACLFATAICAAALSLVMRRKPAVTPIESFYENLCRNMARRGVPRAAWEGPLAYTERVAEAFPENRFAIKRAGKLVARTRYGPDAQSASREELKSLESEILETSSSSGRVKTVVP
jgi:hypothetical protein